MSINKGINLPKAKKTNINLIKKVIYQYSPISRAEIATLLGLVPATITNNVAHLIEEGLVREVASEAVDETIIGRRPIMLETVPDYTYFIGLEISPRGLYMVITDLNGNLVIEKHTQLKIGEYDETMNAIYREVDAFILESGMDSDRIHAMGFGIPGIVNHKTGELKSTAWITWTNHHIERDLKNYFGMPVVVDNNVTTRAIAEGLFEDNRAESFAYLFVSQGIACPLMIKNSILSRKVAGAGELGHMAIEVDGPQCPRCGDYGCLDLYAAEVGIINRAKEKCAANQCNILKNIVEKRHKFGIEEVMEAAGEGDEEVLEILDSAVKYLAIGICNVIKFISPEMVVVDAYIMSNEAIKSKFLEYVDIHLSQNRWGKVEFVFKAFNAYGGALSAAGNAINQFIFNS